MLIKEAAKSSGLTKKAIEYYIEQELIAPKILCNGYREFEDKDIEALKKISVYRRLGLSIEEIKEVQRDLSGSALKKFTLKKELKVQREELKRSMLEELSRGKSYREMEDRLRSLEEGNAVIDRLLDLFPGYYGHFLSLHFARFLQEPISTEEQKAAYKEIIEFLDGIPALEFPPDLQEYFTESTKDFTSENIHDIMKETKKSIENTEDFLKENKEIIEAYHKYKQSQEYKDSPAYKIEKLLKDFNSTNGYNDIFIPAMKRLSPAYNDYYRQLEIANEKFLKSYPELEKLYNERD
ncbi:MerR family transcriptional regulator [Alloiococcus sp. CFN-8]|uniref:MerR family transcriptional regulator n=1 Tax=Alloiococcus sp. CFN-8 TaxID=3416081 RepID=UPI003CF3B1EF